MIARVLTAILVVGALLASEARAEETSNGAEPIKTDVRFHWQPDSRTVTVTFMTGCLSAHGRVPLTADHKVYLDRDYLQFDIQGGYLRGPRPKVHYGPRTGPADCMGARSESVTVIDVQKETYLVNRHGEKARTIELADEEVTFFIDDGGRSANRKSLPHFFKIAR